MCPATISASIMAANMWKNGLKNVESDNNKILYETLLDFLQRIGTYFLNKPRTSNVVSVRSLKKTDQRQQKTYALRTYPGLLLEV